MVMNKKPIKFSDRVGNVVRGEIQGIKAKATIMDEVSPYENSILGSAEDMYKKSRALREAVQKQNEEASREAFFEELND